MLLLLSFSFLLYSPIWFPTWHFQAFAPYLIFYLHRDSLYSYLWRLFFCGMMIDLLSASTYFGQTSLIYVILGGALHSRRSHFFVEKWITAPLLTFLFTSLSTLFNAFFDKFLNGSFSLSWGWAATDLFQMPLIESLFAMLFFTLPFQLREAWNKIQTKKRLRI